jgi:hypothetical protein
MERETIAQTVENYKVYDSNLLKTFNNARESLDIANELH